MTHLGSRISALADGQLGPLETEQAFVHVAGCAQCAAELRAARAARTALAGADDVRPAPELTSRLLALGTRQLPEPRPTPATASGTLGRPLRRTVHIAAVGMLAAGLGTAGLIAAGNGPAVSPPTDAADALAALADAGTAAPSATQVSAVTGDDDLEWLSEHGWAGPKRLPAGVSLTAVSTPAQGSLRMDLSADGGDIVVRETTGRLSGGSVDALAHWDLGGRRVYVVSTAPWHLVWQCGSSVVDVVANTDRETVRSLVGSFPADGYDTSLPARLERGWQATTRALGAS